MATSQYIRFPAAIGSGGFEIPTQPAVVATAPVQVSVTSAATKVFAATTGVSSVTVQNESVVPVTIGQTNAVTAGAKGIVLNACSVAGDGTGGSWTTTNYCGDLWAITASATANVGVQATSAT